MAATVLWPDTLFINSDWSDSPKVNILRNKPEVGPPISRARSRNIEHTLTVTVDMSYNDYTTTFQIFLQSIAGGLKPFRFKSPLDSQTYDAYLTGDTPYTIKRCDDHLYTVGMTITYRQLGAF